jgi:quercetin dioxygenase-like cupin family protein
MSVVTAPIAPTHELPGTRFTRLVAPSTGSTEVSVWRVEIDPGTQPTPHEVTREEVFLVLSGRAVLHLAGDTFEASTGDAMVIPPHTRFSLANAGEDPLTMVTYLPVGGQARLPEGEPFTPPWAQ